MADVLKKFGKYFLLDLVAQGGMAEIYRARLNTPDGGVRLVAIKRVLASYSRNQDFVKMFKAEINTTSALNHPNIVQIYDFGEQQSMLYLSMELIDGKNLRQIINRSQEEKKSLPVELCLYMIAQAASAMAYAHQYKDKISGKNLNIVHRDISPQNILISYDGAVKLIDFGIAKAVSNSETTRAGIIKGKPSYLSPEQISGEELDGRSDIFALGIVLWEILVGRKLFVGENDFAVIKMIENCAAYVEPPSKFNPKVSPEVDAIVLNCLHKKRDERYASAEMLYKAIQKHIHQNYPELTSSDLAEYLKTVFKNEIVEDRKKLLRLNEKASQLLEIVPDEDSSEIIRHEQTATVPMRESSETGVRSKAIDKKTLPEFQQNKTKATTSRNMKDPSGYREIDFNKNEKTNIRIESHATDGKSITNSGFMNASSEQYALASVNRSRSSTPPPMAEQKRKSSLVAFAAAIALFALGYFLYQRNEVSIDRFVASNTAPAKKATLVVSSPDVVDATIRINGKEMSEKQLPAVLSDIPADVDLVVDVQSNGMKRVETQRIKLQVNDTQTLTFHFEHESEETASANEKFAVRLSILPIENVDKTKVKVNGKELDPVAPLSYVDPSKAIDVEVYRDGFEPWVEHQYRLSPSIVSGKREAVISVQLKAADYGYLSIHTVPSGQAFYEVNGEKMAVTTPVSNLRLPEGVYSIKLYNKSLDITKYKTVSVKKNNKTILDETLYSDDSSGKRKPSSR